MIEPTSKQQAWDEPAQIAVYRKNERDRTNVGVCKGSQYIFLLGSEPQSKIVITWMSGSSTVVNGWSWVQNL